MKTKTRKNLHLDGVSIYLRTIKISDVTNEYVRWLNSKKINEFLESRFTKHDLMSIKKFVKNTSKNPDIIFLTIIRRDTEKHIGNIKMGPIDWHHRIGEIGIMVGDRKSWGKGFATDAINTLTDYAFNILKLHKVIAGAYENNIGSKKAFQKAGFFIEGNRKKHYLHKRKYVNHLLFGKLNKSNLI